MGNAIENIPEMKLRGKIGLQTHLSYKDDNFYNKAL